MKLSKTGSNAIAVVTWLVSLYVFYWFFESKLYSANPWFAASIVMISIAVHELGHQLMMERNGLRTTLFFAVILGGAVPHKPDQLKQLSWNQQASIYLAGVIGNVLVVVAGWLLFSVGVLSGEHASQIANVNGLLIMWNLVPWAIFDGGRFAKILFNSIPEDRDLRQVLLISFVIGVSAIFGMLVVNGDVSLAFLLMFWGLHFQAHHDDPTGSSSRLAMTRSQIKMWTVVYCGLMIFAMILVAKTPFWLVKAA